MQIEYEATFPNINKNEMRLKLKKAGAAILRPEFLQKRVVFNMPKGYENNNVWIRVRDEGNRITMSIKQAGADSNQIHNIKELKLVVDNFENAEKFLSTLHCQKKSYQETKREIWNLDGVEICLDEWPYLEPLVEIEGDDEESVKKVSQKLGLDYKKAKFCSATELYSEKYGVSCEIINNNIPEITFGGKNPFENI